MYGKRIKELREERSWTQAHLAQEMNCVQKTISRYERQEADLGTQEIIKLCHIFKVSSDFLLGLEDETGAKTYR